MAQSKNAAENLSSLAQQTETDVDVVKSLYSKQVADLEATATIKTFIGVLATGRVKRHLRSLREQRRG